MRKRSLIDYSNKTTEEILHIAEIHRHLTYGEISEVLRDKGIKITPDAIRKRVSRVRKREEKLKQTPEEILKQERTNKSERSKANLEHKALKEAISKLEIAERQLELALALDGNITTYVIKPTKDVRSEAIAIVLASDWHIEEQVKKSQVSGTNEYNLTISQNRAEQFFINTVKLIKKEQRAIEIKTLILALLGDFITNSELHNNEMAEGCLLTPSEATEYATSLIASGIKYILKNTNVNLIIPCAVGNHGRTTTKMRAGYETGHSYEYLMYALLRKEFQNEKRCIFIIGEGYHIYLQAFNFTLRFHHGHNIRYGGGIGGLTIPANKAIAQWNRLKVADYDFWGHFHQFFDGGNFICNGSMIGYNAYALSIKASFEYPKQAFFLIDRRFGKTVVVPIRFE